MAARLAADEMAANACNRAAKEFTHMSCTFGMMRGAFGPALPATSRSTVVVVRAAKTGPDFAREVPKGTNLSTYIRIFRISRGKSQGSNLQPSSPNLESSRVSAVDIVVLAFSSSGDRAGGTVRTARVSCVRLCTMGDFSKKSRSFFSESAQSHETTTNHDEWFECENGPHLRQAIK